MVFIDDNNLIKSGTKLILVK